MLHEDAGIEVANRSAVGKDIAGHLRPHTWRWWRCRVHGREPGDAHSVRDVFEQTPVSTEAEDEGHMVAAACTADTNGTVHLAMLEPAWTSSGSNCALI